MRKIFGSEWNELRDAAWEWDPIRIGADSRDLAADEYECVIEAVVPLLQRGATADEIVKHFEAFLPEHFGIAPQPEARDFAGKAIAWWDTLAREGRGA